MRIRHLSMGEWAVVLTVLWLILGLGLVLDADSLRWVATLGFAVLTIERTVNWVRCRRPKLCGLNPLGDREHGCVRPADGHTMHRCAHGDCSWGF